MSDSLEIIDLWQKMFIRFTSPHNIAFPKCLWYHRYFFFWVKDQPRKWDSFFWDSNFDSMGIFKPLNNLNDEVEVGISSIGQYRFIVDSPLTVDMDIQEISGDERTLSSGFLTQS